MGCLVDLRKISVDFFFVKEADKNNRISGQCYSDSLISCLYSVVIGAAFYLADVLDIRKVIC